MHTHLASKTLQCGKGGGGSMTHRHMETITFGTCLVICAPTHKHTYTHAHTHFDIGTGTVEVPCLQALSGGGASLLSHIFQGGGGA